MIIKEVKEVVDPEEVVVISEVVEEAEAVSPHIPHKWLLLAVSD